MSDKIVTLFKKIDSEIVKAMVYERDKKRVMSEGWKETHAEAETEVYEETKTEPVKRQRKSKGAEDGDDSGTTD